MDENHLKQRIVGAVVLVALAVIFIPMLLSGDRDEGMSIVESNIPPRPENVERVKTLDIEPEQPPPAESMPRQPVDEHTPASSTDSESADQAPESAPAADTDTDTQDTDGKAWAVQVGSFSKQSNALGLRDKLRKGGYPAFVEKVSTSKGVVYRVRVGPEVRRDKAEALQKELLAKLKLDGLVVAHP